MEFKFDGLDEPFVLPDAYMTTIQYERLQRHLLTRNDEQEDVRSIREVLAAFLGADDLLANTDDLPMSPHNVEQWQKILDHIVFLSDTVKQIGDDITNEVVKGEDETSVPVEGEPDDAPLDPRPTEPPTNAE